MLCYVSSNRIHHSIFVLEDQTADIVDPCSSELAINYYYYYYYYLT